MRLRIALALLCSGCIVALWLLQTPDENPSVKNLTGAGSVEATLSTGSILDIVAYDTSGAIVMPTVSVRRDSSEDTTQVYQAQLHGDYQRVAELDAGHYSITVSTATTSIVRAVALRERSRRIERFDFPATATIDVRVTAVDDAKLPGTVTVAMEDVDLRHEAQAPLVDGKVLFAVPVPASYQITYRDELRNAAQVVYIEHAQTVRLEVPPSVAVRGSFTDIDGKPVGGMRVRWFGPIGVATDPDEDMDEARNSSGRTFETEVADNGTFVIPGVEPGRYSFLLLEYPSHVSPYGDVEIVAATDLAIVLGQGRHVTLRRSDWNGVPGPWQAVTMIGDYELEIASGTGQDLHMTIPVSPPPRIFAHTTEEPWKSGSVLITASAELFRVEMHPYSWMTIRLDSRWRRHHTGLRYRVSYPDDPDASTDFEAFPDDTNEVTLLVDSPDVTVTLSGDAVLLLEKYPDFDVGQPIEVAFP
ncbi:MAG: hypothetical protein AAF581_07760 [Planctomycetota bacterium]